jgi:PilZ domain
MDGREERRTSARSAYKRPIQFDLNLTGSKGWTTVEKDGAAVDISESGLGFFTRYPLKKGEVLRLHFPLNSVKMTLPVFAEVAWAKPVENRFRVGMQFLR